MLAQASVVQAVMLPYPQAGIDVDKVEDLLLAESVLTEFVPSVSNETKPA